MARGDFRQRVVFEVDDQASGPAGRIAGSFDEIRSQLTALAAAGLVGKVFGEVRDFLLQGAEAAIRAEQATARLNAALQQGAPGATAYAEALGRQSEGLERLGLASSESIKGVQALLSNLGVAGSQLELATQAAVDLSAALGTSLESAAVNVGKTTAGLAGELGELVPELRALSAESLRAGEGIELLAERFGGQAAQQAETYAASLERLRLAYEGLSEAAGGGLVGEGASGAVRELADALEQFGAAAEGSRISQFLGDAEERLLGWGAALVRGSLAVQQYFGLLKTTTPATREAAEAMLEAESAAKAEARALEQRAAAQEAAARAQDEFTEAVRALGVVLESDVSEKLRENNALLDQADELYRRGVITRRDFEEVERAVAEAERELNAELSGTAELLNEAAVGFDGAATAADTYRTRIDALATSSRSATLAAQGLSNALGLVARSASSQGLVDAAVAAGNTPYLGGTRIRLPGGGSRLVGR